MGSCTSPSRARLAIAVLLACCLSSCSAVSSSGRGGPHGASHATVEHVVDGDTVDLQFGSRTERVRLLGIDTPETVKPNTPVQCFGPEASARTKALLPRGTPVRVARDAEARDRYGRLLLYIYRSADGAFVNRMLVAEGYARILSISPNTAHATDLAVAAASARGARRGLWTQCTDPALPP